MGKKICENCEQIIGNLEESFFHKNHVVCKACKILLEEFQSIEVVGSAVEPEIPILGIPPQVAADDEHKSTDGTTQRGYYGGIRRTGYFFGMLGVVVVNAIFSAAAQDESGIAFLGAIITLVLSFILVVNRLRNTGTSGWWSLLILVPLANLFIGIRCAMCPEGYQDTKKLDTAGKIIAGIFIGLFVVMFLGIFLAMLSS